MGFISSSMAVILGNASRSMGGCRQTCFTWDIRPHKLDEAPAALGLFRPVVLAVGLHARLHAFNVHVLFMPQSIGGEGLSCGIVDAMGDDGKETEGFRGLADGLAIADMLLNGTRLCVPVTVQNLNFRMAAADFVFCVLCRCSSSMRSFSTLSSSLFLLFHAVSGL